MSQEDRAQDEEAFLWGLRNKARAPDPEYKPGEKGYGPEFCKNEDCGAAIPELSRRRGCTHCTDCRSAAERAAKRGY